MTEHKCPNCGHVYSYGICCKKCGTVFLFNDEYNNKSDAEKIEEKKIEKEKYELANEIISSSPQNDFEAKRREIIEDLLRQREARAAEKKKAQEAIRLAQEKQAEEAKKRAQEEAAYQEELRQAAIKQAALEEAERLKAEENAKAETETTNMDINEAKAVDETECTVQENSDEKSEEAKKEAERKALEERYAAIRRAEREKMLAMMNEQEKAGANELEDENKDADACNAENQSALNSESDALENEIEATRIYKKSDFVMTDEEENSAKEIEENDASCDDLTDDTIETVDNITDDKIETVDNINEEELNKDASLNYEDQMQETLHIAQGAKIVGNEQIESESKGDTLLLKFLRKFMIFLYSITVIAALLPVTKFVDMSAGYNISMIDIVVISPIILGLVIAIAEKTFIRKYIVGFTLAISYLGVDLFIRRTIIPSSIRDIVFTTLFLLLLVISIIGIFGERSKTLKKMRVWFDFIVYLILMSNVFVLVFAGALWIVAPMFVTGVIKMDVIVLMVINLLNILASILMLKRKSGGVDLFLANSIASIVFVVVVYNQMMNATGYGVGFDYMHTVGDIYSCFIAMCVIFPIIIFAWLKAIVAKEKREVR